MPDGRPVGRASSARSSASSCAWPRRIPRGAIYADPGHIAARRSSRWALDYRAHLSFNPEAGKVRVVLSGGAALSQPLRLRLVHPTRVGLDRSLLLEARSAGVYEAALALPASGRWWVTLEDTTGVWRLAGEWRVPETLVVALEPLKR